MSTSRLNESKTHFTSFKTRLEAYAEQKNGIPDNIFLIWIGDDIPNTVEQPYLQNAIRHKILCPTAKVDMLVNQKLLEKSGKWLKLQEIAVQNKIRLRDIETTCKGYINYDIVLELMQKKVDYVRASDILRLSLMYHEGGRYFDTDLEPIMGRRIEPDKNPRYGFYQFYSLIEEEQCGQPFFQAAVKGHFVYLYASVIVRYQHIELEKELKRCSAEQRKVHWINCPFLSVRRDAIANLSGNHIMTFLQAFDMEKPEISYPLSLECNIKMDQTWCQGYATPKTVVELSIIKFLQKKSLDFFVELWLKIPKEGFLNQKEKEYFGLDNAHGSKPVDDRKKVNCSFHVLGYLFRKNDKNIQPSKNITKPFLEHSSSLLGKRKR
jgi:hypothetical protein